MPTKRQEITSWLKTILDEKGWSAERLGREAGVAGTTITRGLSTTGSFMPSMSTLLKISKASGYALPWEGSRTRQIKVVDNHDIIRGALKGMDVTVTAEAEGDFVTTIQNDAMSPDILPGDKVTFIVAQPHEIADGKTVLTVVNDQVEAARLIGNMLIPSNRSRQPYPVSSCEVVGLITTVIRQLD